jgi:tRNA threonylcarbamoyladenosine biosynthesis protein TsaE
MGAGKTTLIKYLSRALGALSDVSSPTFSIVNEYTIQADKKIYHFDFYRIHKESEALDIGWEEYLYSGQYCFIEWAERIPSLLPAAYISLHIQVNADESRTITMVVHEG